MTDRTFRLGEGKFGFPGSYKEKQGHFLETTSVYKFISNAK